MRPDRDPWLEYAEHPVSDWQYEVANGDTRRGYAEWVEAKMEEDAHDAAAQA